MHTENRIVIDAPPHPVYILAAEIEQWPLRLEHYRYVKILENLYSTEHCQCRLVKMSATRSAFPTVWTAIQEMYPEALEIRYRWTGGIPKGMLVHWRIEPAAQGVEVTIEHELQRFRWWWLRNPIAEYIVGHVFIEHIAQRTLTGIKRHAEAPNLEIGILHSS